MRHHYVPVFYLRQWAEASDGKVPYFQWIDGRIVSSRRTPENTGYEDDLYAKNNVPDSQRHVIEGKLFSPLDNAAAPIYRRMLKLEKFELTPAERVTWAAFLMAANARVPGIVNEARAKYAASAREEFLKDSDEYERAKGDAKEATFLEWVNNHRPGLIENFGLDTMVRHITDKDRLQERWLGYSRQRFAFDKWESLRGFFPCLPLLGVTQGGRSPTGVRPDNGGGFHAAATCGR